MIPSEKRDAFWNAPPTNVLKSPNSEFWKFENAPLKASPSTPGIGIWAPIRTIIKTPKVNRILNRNSGIENILLIFSIILQ